MLETLRTSRWTTATSFHSLPRARSDACFTTFSNFGRKLKSRTDLRPVRDFNFSPAAAPLRWAARGHLQARCRHRQEAKLEHSPVAEARAVVLIKSAGCSTAPSSKQHRRNARNPEPSQQSAFSAPVAISLKQILLVNTKQLTLLLLLGDPRIRDPHLVSLCFVH